MRVQPRSRPRLSRYAKSKDDSQQADVRYDNLSREGIVAKRRDSRYRSGRCQDWIKIKNIAHPAIERVMLPELLPAV
jgi:ATP-dependent DNA ligase